MIKKISGSLGYFLVGLLLYMIVLGVTASIPALIFAAFYPENYWDYFKIWWCFMVLIFTAFSAPACIDILMKSAKRFGSKEKDGVEIVIGEKNE